MSDQSVDLMSLLGQWKNGLRQRQVAHWRIASSFDRRSYLFGGTAALLSAVVGTGIIASLEKATVPWGPPLFAVLSLSSALFAALQAFLDYPKRATAHEVAAAEFGGLRRECELMLTTSAAGDLGARAEALRAAWADAEKHAPALVQAVFDRVKAELRRENPSG